MRALRQEAQAVFVTLHDWMVGDGQVPRPVVGAKLRGVGLRAEAYSLDMQDHPPGMSKLDSAQAGGRPHAYRLAGRAGAPHDVLVSFDERPERLAVEFRLDVGDFAVLAWVQPPRDDIVAGDAVCLHAVLHVVADYEFDAFQLPDVRRDWVVKQVLEGGPPDYRHHHLDLEPVHTRGG